MKPTDCLIDRCRERKPKPLRSRVVHLIAICLLALAISPTAAIANMSDSARLPILDSIQSDSLIVVDSSQPRFRVGAYVGPSAATAHLRDVPLDPDLAPGYFLGIRSELEFAAPLYFLLEAELYDRRLYSSPRNQQAITSWDFHFYYLQFPILFQLNVPTGPGPSITGGVGVVPSIVLTRKQVLGGEGLRDTTLSLDTGVQNFDFGFEFRLGTEWRLGPKTALTLDIRYLLGLQNILILATREDPRVWKARTVGLSVGWVYQLQRPIYRD